MFVSWIDALLEPAVSEAPLAQAFRFISTIPCRSSSWLRMLPPLGAIPSLRGGSGTVAPPTHGHPPSLPRTIPGRRGQTWQSAPSTSEYQGHTHLAGSGGCTTYFIISFVPQVVVTSMDVCLFCYVVASDHGIVSVNAEKQAFYESIKE